MVRVGDAEVVVTADARLATNHEGRDPGRIGLKCQGQQVEHEPGVLDIVDRDAGGPFAAGAASGCALNPLLYVAKRGEVFIELATVARAKAGRQLPSLLDRAVEDALPQSGPSCGRFGVETALRIPEE